MGNVAIASVAIHEQRICGEGNVADPRLLIPLTITMHQQPPEGQLAITALICSLHLVPAGQASAQNRVGQEFTLSLLQELPCRSLNASPCTCDVEVRFPLSQSLISLLETHRHERPENDVCGTLLIVPTVMWVKDFGNVSEPGMGLITDPRIRADLGIYYSTKLFWGARSTQVPVKVSAETWVKQVLPQVGLNAVRLVEVAFPKADGVYPEQAIRYFDEAQRDYDLGHYRECIEKCRYVRHAIEEDQALTRGQKVADTVAQRLGLDLEGPQHDFLDRLWDGFAVMTNAAHHNDHRQQLLRADAQSCLLLAALLLDYLNQLR